MRSACTSVYRRKLRWARDLSAGASRVYPELEVRSVPEVPHPEPSEGSELKVLARGHSLVASQMHLRATDHHRRALGDWKLAEVGAVLSRRPAHLAGGHARWDGVTGYGPRRDLNADPGFEIKTRFASTRLS